MKVLCSILGSLFVSFVYGQNPLVPGYFADPSIRYMDGKYYLSITSDGYDEHNGEPFLWVSDNLVDWNIEYLDINDRFFWAPSMLKGDNGKYYMVRQQGVDYLAYILEADAPQGPWQEIIQVKDFDVELFRDPKTGQIMGIGSWKNLLVFDNDIHSPNYMRKVVSSTPIKGELTDFTEAPYMFTKDSKYYLMWAGGHCWLDSYNVRYAVTDALDQPFREFSKEPILESLPEKQLYGPGHTSVLEVNGRWLLFYHRQDPKRYPTCNYRFSCVAEMFFSPEGQITKVVPLDDLRSLGLGLSNPTNIALNKPVVASASASDDFLAAFLTDGRNDSRWQSVQAEDQWVTIDLEDETEISRIQIEFEYFDRFYLYEIQYSSDNENWHTYADYTHRALKGYQTRTSEKTVSARYIKINIKRAERDYASIWEIKVFSSK
ncbi:family 43 glycosylhydrolase [Olivibacter sitiensis]|uniref:family 43 glycosylhydrolase n=1 Tax=Olivibacter sitiensis TaxID=376470 RepID=UPI00146FB687|nr:family 43 glycosylhydrolase [Olivibacter sitiensis]